ncbi:MAG: glycerophosphodiester phosphodiesterase [Acidimicrobiales bacterium]
MTDVYAHRGAHLNTRENTLDAFREARSLGVAGVELDVRRTADGALVVHHDPVVELMVIAHTNAADLPGFVPHLDESLAELRGLRVNVEIKNSRDPAEPTYDDSGSLVREVVACVEASPGSSVLISCFDRATCRQVRELRDDVEVAWLLAKGSLNEYFEIASEERFNALNPHYSMVTPESQRRAAERGLSLNVWTVNSARDLTAMGQAGVASVITDEPVLALELLG